MRNESDFRRLVANNIITYRKINNMTQIQLAEKLNYSDKAISKWERGESLPDLYILAQLAELFGITINDLTTEQLEPKKPTNKLNKTVVTLLSVGLTWLVAFVIFVILQMAQIEKAWLAFSYALPVSLIVLIVFSKIWHNRLLVFIGVSGLFYSIPLAICLQLDWQYRSALLFIIAIPMQVLTILWFIRKFQN